MIDKINDVLIKKYLSRCSELTDFDKERIEYALRIIIEEIEKFLTVAIVFIIIGRVKEFMLSFFVLMSLRTFIGGIHFSTRFRCLMFTIFFFVVVVFMAEYFTINKPIGFIISCVAVINIALCAPLPSKHRKLLLERGKENLRKQAIGMMAICVVCYCLASKKIANILVCTVIMQQIELLTYKVFIERIEIKHEDKRKNK